MLHFRYVLKTAMLFFMLAKLNRVFKKLIIGLVYLEIYI